MRRIPVLLALLLSLPAARLTAQVMPTQVIRRGAPSGLAMSDGEPISFVLEHASLLDLTDPQRTNLMNIRRKLRAANEPYMHQLDSLRSYLGISMEPRQRITEDDRSRLAKFEQMSQPIADSIRVNNDAANLQARALLDTAQLRVLDSIVVQERGRIGGRRPPPPRR